MANTSCSLNIHRIFSTKERAPMLNPELRERLWQFLGGIAKQNGITPRCIGGVADHVHLLLSLPTTVPIALFGLLAGRHLSASLRSRCRAEPPAVQ